MVEGLQNSCLMSFGSIPGKPCIALFKLVKSKGVQRAVPPVGGPPTQGALHPSGYRSRRETS